MKYMLLIYGDEQALDAEEREKCYGESAGLARDLNASGKYLGASPLQLTSSATSVSVSDGKRTVTDGQFANTRGTLGGYNRNVVATLGVDTIAPPRMPVD